MSSIPERTLDGFLSDYRIVTVATESIGIQTPNILKKIFITVEQREQTPAIYFNRGIIPYSAPTENINLFLASLTGAGQGISFEYASYYAGVSLMNSYGMKIVYDENQLKDAAHCNIGYSPNGKNMYGAFKVLYDNYKTLEKYPYFYTITGGNQPQQISSFTGVVEKGASAGTYTLVNFGGTIAPFQLMFHPNTIGITHSNGLPTGTASSPLFFGLSGNTPVESSAKDLYFVPDMHFSLRRNLNILLDRGMTFNGIMASFQPYQEFIKYADNDFLDTQTNIISSYNGNSANPAWTVELLRYAGTTSGLFNINGFNLANDFNNKFFSEIKTYPVRYKSTKDTYNIGHYGIPYTTSVFGYVSSIPTPGIALDGTGPYASDGQSYYINRLAGITLYPPPVTYNYLGATGATAFGGSGGSVGWNSYHKSTAVDSSYYPEYFMLGGTLNAASNTYAASRLIPANILKLFVDNSGPRGPLGITMNFLDSYYNDIFQEVLQYSGYQNMNFYPMEFIPKFNPLIPMQVTGSDPINNSPSRRDCTIHSNFGGNSAERLFNLKSSMRDSIQSATKVWKLLLDNNGKYEYRIMPVLTGRNDDRDLTRGGSVPYEPSDFVEYLIKPLFVEVVPANGFLIKDNIEQLLYEGFYLGNISRGANEFTDVVTNNGVSGSNEVTAFIRGLETYFFDLNAMQQNMRFDSYLHDIGLTGSISNHASYKSTFNSGRMSDYRVYETNTGTTGGNTKIPYGFAGTFDWFTIPLRSGCIIQRNASLSGRWIDPLNNNISTAYKIMRDAYFELTKEQILATKQYFATEKITTLVEYRATDKFVGR